MIILTPICPTLPLDVSYFYDTNPCCAAGVLRLTELRSFGCGYAALRRIADL
jgi:hypothetical protein